MEYSSGRGFQRSIVRQLVRAVRGSYFGFPTEARNSARRCFGHISRSLPRLLAVFDSRSLDSSLALGGVLVTSPPSQQIDFRAELVSLLDNQIRYLQ